MNKKVLALGAMLFVWLIGAKAEVDPNFYIYLCFGQSNMEGNADVQSVDKQGIDQRFQMLATTNFDSPKRTMGQWYTATPPIVSPQGKLGMADYFGRTMVAALPAGIKVGVVDVAIGGCAIEMFDKDQYKTQMTDPSNWSTQLANKYYGGNPWNRLVTMAKKAQESGVIKGILLHQGESNNTQQDWPDKVKKIYTDLLKELNMAADSVPLFAGETLREENGGACWGHNAVIAKLPSVIPTSHVISSEACPGNGVDPWHFNALGYRIMGRRYAYAALELMGIEPMVDPDYTMPATLKKFFAVKSLNVESNITAVPGQRIPVKATFEDGHTEDVTGTAFNVTSGDIAFNGDALASKGDGQGTADLIFTDFTRQQTTKHLNLSVSYFPFVKGVLKQLAGTLTLDTEARSIKLNASGQAGWVYDNRVDMSDYKYLVVKLKERQTCGAQIRIYAQTNVSNAGYVKDIGSATTVKVDLKNLKYSNRTINPAKISVVAFRAGSAGTLYIDDIYLTNNEDLSPTDILDSTADSPTAVKPVYSLQGVRLGTTDQWDQLPRGTYIVGDKVIQK